MEFMCARCKEEQAADSDSATSVGTMKKYTYVLPSGRTVKVFVDDESDFVQTASSTPCFVLRMEDDPDS